MHTARQWFQRNAGDTSKAFLKIDFENAFNTVDRISFLQECRQHRLRWRNGAGVSAREQAGGRCCELTDRCYGGPCTPLEPYSYRHMVECSSSCRWPRQEALSGLRACGLFAMGASSTGEQRGDSTCSESGGRARRPLVGRPRGEMQQGRFVGSRLKSSRSFDSRAGASSTLSGVVWCHMFGIF